MRIISKTRDFYDPIQKYGQDLNLVYIREPKEVWLLPKAIDFPVYPGRFTYSWGKKKHVIVESFVVGFCNKIYGAIRVDKQICFNEIEVDCVFEEEMRTGEYEAYKKNKYFVSNPQRKNVIKFFDYCDQRRNSYKDVFEEHKSPIFVTDKYRYNLGYRVLFNITLKEWEFYRVFDAYTAFQEINMWWSNQAVPLKPLPVVSDRDLIVAKSFDLKTSFRKDKKNGKKAN